jgi:hypothetical protein
VLFRTRWRAISRVVHVLSARYSCVMRLWSHADLSVTRAGRAHCLCVVSVLCRASSARCRIVLRVVNSLHLESLVLIILLIYLTTVSVVDLIKTTWQL